MHVRKGAPAECFTVTPTQRGGKWKRQEEGRGQIRRRVVQTGVLDVAVEYRKGHKCIYKDK